MGSELEMLDELEERLTNLQFHLCQLSRQAEKLAQELCGALDVERELEDKKRIIINGSDPATSQTLRRHEKELRGILKELGGKKDGDNDEENE